MEKKKCTICGTEYEKPYDCSRNKWEKSKYCSKVCLYKSHTLRKNRVKCTCQNCGKEFELQASRITNGRGKNCSKKCLQEYMLKNNHGDNHNSWKDGTYLKDGYRYIWKPEHPKANNIGYVREHRLVMEEKLGRLLKINEIVHHMNHDRSDNNPDNLMLMNSHSQHKRYHDGERAINKATLRNR